jgi:hypothetical protein
MCGRILLEVIDQMEEQPCSGGRCRSYDGLSEDAIETQNAIGAT